MGYISSPLANSDRCSSFHSNGQTFLLYLGWGLWLMVRFWEETTLASEWAECVDDFFQIIALVALISAEVLSLKRYGKLDLKVGIVSALLLVSAFQCNDKNLMWILVMLYFLRDVDTRKLLLFSARLLTLLFLLTIVLFSLDLLKDAIQYRSDGIIRSSVGFVWPSRAGNYLLAIGLTYICAKKEECSVWALILLLAASLVVFSFTMARNPFVFTVLLVLMWFITKWFAPSKPSRFLAIIMTYLPVVLAVICIVFAVSYTPSSTWMAELNGFLSNRLFYSSNAFLNSGITLFGCPDYGGENVHHATTGYLDSGYLRLLFTFGVIPFAMVIACFCALGRTFASRGDRYLVLCIAIVLMRSVMDGGFVYLQETPVYFYLFYCLNTIAANRVFKRSSDRLTLVR